MGETTLRQAFVEFQTTYMPARNYAARTRVEYGNDIQELTTFLEQKGINRVGEVSLSHLENYLAHLDRHHLAGSTRKRKTIAIRAFFGFLRHRGLVTQDISRKLIPPFAESITPRLLTPTEYQKLQNTCTGNLRDTALVELLFHTGIRLSELVGLAIYDIELSETNESGLIRIGGRQSRNLALNAITCKSLITYLKGRRNIITPTLFLNRFGNPLGARGVQKIIEKYLTVAGIHGASVHSLRHTFGAGLAAKGLDLKKVQEMMGIQDIRAVEVYFDLAKTILGMEIPGGQISIE